MCEATAGYLVNAERQKNQIRSNLEVYFLDVNMLSMALILISDI
jgi:hypothetical protein